MNNGSHFYIGHSCSKYISAYFVNDMWVYIFTEHGEKYICNYNGNNFFLANIGHRFTTF